MVKADPAPAAPAGDAAKPAEGAKAPEGEAAKAPEGEGAKAAEGAKEGGEGEAPKPPPREKNIYEKAGVHHYEPGHKIYGHPTYKKMIDKYLPYHAALDPSVKFVYGWH